MEESNRVSRVEWQEMRGDVLFFMIAERDPWSKWRFFERSTWEVRWYSVDPTPEHIAKAEQLHSKV